MQASNFGAWQLATSRWVDLLDAAPGKEASVCYGWKKAVMEEHVDVSLLLQGTKPLTMSSVAAPSRHSPGTVPHVGSPPRVDHYAVAMQAAKRLAVRAAPPIPPGPRWLQRRAGCVQGACLPLEARCESQRKHTHVSCARLSPSRCALSRIISARVCTCGSQVSSGAACHQIITLSSQSMSLQVEAHRVLPRSEA